MSKQPVDFLQREQALDPTQSFICEAPAGSGKTELLTQRVLTLLARVSRPEQVLAITFTRKAAGEMRERVFHAIQSGLQPRPEEPHKIKTWELANEVIKADQANQWHLLENPNRLQIKTFDSLCASLASSLPLESSFGAKPQINDESEDLYRMSARALLHSLEDDIEWADGLSVLLSQLDNKYSRLEDLLINMLARREEWAPLLYQHDRQQIRAILEKNLNSIIKDTIGHVKALIPNEFHGEIVSLAGFAAANLKQAGIDSPIRACDDIDVDNQQLPGNTPKDVAVWLGLFNLFSTQKGEWRKSLTKNCGFPAGDNAAEKKAFKEKKQQLLEIIDQLKKSEAIRESLNDLNSLPSSTFNNAQWDLLNALFEVLPVLIAQLTLSFKDSNTVDFAEISIQARKALGQLDDPSQLALKLDYQIQHILVDEFQDTSYSQVELLERLTSGWQPDDGKTLFCVGDAMQSIYGFRGANVGLFLNCRENGLENVSLTPLKLNTNFRSESGIVEWVNKTFAKAFPADNDISRGAVTYSHSEPFHEGNDGKAVHFHGLIDRDDNVDEAGIALEIINETRTKHPEQTIAILVRNRNHASQIAQQLKTAGHRYRAVDLEPLQDHSIIQDLMALTQAMLHPADRTAWLAILRAPWCGLSLIDLEAIANVRLNDSQQLPTILSQALHALSLNKQPVVEQEPEQSDLFASSSVQTESAAINTLSQDGKERLNRVLPILEKGLMNRDRKNFRQWIEGLWVALGGPACLNDQASLTNATLYFDLIEKWSFSTDLSSLEHLQKSVAKLFAAPDPEADDKIQIMTIHKSKGLEFDVVLVPALHKMPRKNDPSLLMWHQRLNHHGQPELIMSPITATGSEKNPTQKHLQAEAAKKDYFETCRLLYVACTRAKRKLHLFANLKNNEKTAELKEPAKSSLMHAIWQAVQLQVIRHDKETEIDITNSASSKPLKPLYRLPKEWILPTLQSSDLLSEFIPRYQYNNDNTPTDISWVSPAARHIGTVIHRYLQSFAEQGIRFWSVDRVHSRRNHIISSLRSLGVPATEISDAADKVTLALKLVLQDDKALEILSDKHAFHACEYPITFLSKAGPKSLVIDRLYTTKQGTTWIIDYKTAAPEPNQSVQDFLHEQKESYDHQLKLYQLALQQAGFVKVKTALYFPLLTEWLPLDQPLENSDSDF